jgi:hypothetical protein
VGFKRQKKARKWKKDQRRSYPKAEGGVGGGKKRKSLWWASIWVDHFQDLIPVFSYVVETPYNLKFYA